MECHLAEFWTKKENSIKCELCPNYCIIKEGSIGNCKVRKNINGKLVSLVYGKPCSIAIDPIEKKPQFHFLPGSLAFSIGTTGCNMHCLFCQNYEISQNSPDEILSMFVRPEDIVSKALKSDCKSIAYTYNEPTIFYEYVKDTAKIAHEKGLKNIFVTNGYINEKPLLEILPLIDGFHVDLKSFNEKYYRNICFAKLKSVLDTLLILKENNKWFEIIYLVIPGENDDKTEIRKMCDWIKTNLGENTVVHFSRFFPCYKMQNINPTPISTMEKIKDIAQESGLKFIYLGNINREENTICPECKKVLIRRSNYEILEYNLKKDKCRFCHAKIPGVFE